MAKRLDEQSLAILSRVTVDGNVVFLTCGQLDRKQYQMVNAVLENIGGKWNRKVKGHVFDGDPTEFLEQVPVGGYSCRQLITVKQIIGVHSIDGCIPVILLPKFLVGKTVKVTIEEQL